MIEQGNRKEKLKNQLDYDPPKGCWHSFSKAVGGMWATREVVSPHNREIFIRTTIRELVVYIVFLILLFVRLFDYNYIVAVTFGRASSTMFYYTTVMSNLFIKYKQVSTVSDLWKFFENQLLDGLYWDYSGESKHFLCNGGDDALARGPCQVAPTDRNILYENRLLGLPRIRQLRVRNDSCAIHVDFQNTIKDCYASYSPSIEDSKPFQPGMRIKTRAEAWKYQSAETLKGTETWGMIGIYSGGGSVQDLHSLKNESAAIIKELKEGLWIQRGTRFISIDFTVYNANINLFCIVQFLFEFPPTGGIVPSASFRTVNLLRYVEAFDYFIMACELVFTAFIGYYVVEEVLEIKKNKLEYFYNLGNILDLLVIAVSVAVILFNSYTAFIIEDEIKELLNEPDQYSDFRFLGFWSGQNSNAAAICVFFAWIKLFKYISFDKTMTQLASTLSRSFKDITGFGIMFFIVFFTFAQLGYLLFGTRVGNFHNFSNAVFTLLRTILGDFNFQEIQLADRVLGPIFFFSYVFFVFFILLNMFLAIINDTYSEVKNELSVDEGQLEVVDYFKSGYDNLRRLAGAENRAMDINRVVKLVCTNPNYTYEEFRQNLKRSNFSDAEIELIFARVKEEEGSDGDYEKKASAILKRGSVLGINSLDFKALTVRVDRVDNVTGTIVSKIDAVLTKLEILEKGKYKKKATMNEILRSMMDDKRQKEADEKEIKNGDSAEKRE